MPLLAISIAGVTVSQAALMRFAFFMPFLLFGLSAGPIVDRLPRRMIMLVCDALQFLVFMLISGLAFFNGLSFIGLMLLVSIGGISLVFFSIAYSSYLPELYSDEKDLHKGNSKLYFSDSISKLLGPMFAGPLIAVLVYLQL